MLDLNMLKVLYSLLAIVLIIYKLTIYRINRFYFQLTQSFSERQDTFPGGKVEAGERTLDAAKRELAEETRLVAQSNPNNEETLGVRWHNFGAFTCSDSIHLQEGSSPSTATATCFHYVISQCFAEVIAPSMPVITASDDASDARWWNAEEIQLAEKCGTVTRGVWRVLQRSEMLYAKGLLECE